MEARELEKELYNEVMRIVGECGEETTCRYSVTGEHYIVYSCKFTSEEFLKGWFSNAIKCYLQHVKYIKNEGYEYNSNAEMVVYWRKKPEIKEVTPDSYEYDPSCDLKYTFYARLLVSTKQPANEKTREFLGITQPVNVLDQYRHTDTESSNITTTGSHPGDIDNWKEYEDQARREGRDITGFGLKPIEEETAPEGYEVGSFPGEKINEPIPAKGINEWEGWKPHKHIEEEPELNEEAISKLCDDLIEAKKKPLSAAQIIDKYARRY